MEQSPNPPSLESHLLILLNLERLKIKACILNEDFYSNAILENMIASGESLSQSELFSRNNFFCPEVDFFYLECVKPAIYNKRWNNDNLKMAHEILTYNVKIHYHFLMDKKHTHIALRFYRNDAKKIAKLYIILTVKLIIIEEISFESECIKITGFMNDGNLMVSSLAIIDERQRNLLIIGCEGILVNENEKSFRINFIRAPFANGDFHLDFYCSKGWENLTYGNNFNPNTDINQNVPIIGDLKLRTPLISISKIDYKSLLKTKNGEIKKNENMSTNIRQNSPCPKLFNKLSTLASVQNNSSHIFENERSNSPFNTQTSLNMNPNNFFPSNENKMYSNHIQKMETESSPKIESKNLTFSIPHKIFDNIKDGLQIFDKNNSKSFFSPLKHQNIQNKKNQFDVSFDQKKNNSVFFEIPINNRQKLNENPFISEQNLDSNKQSINFFNPFQNNSNNHSSYIDCNFNKCNETNLNQINYQEKPISPIFFPPCPLNNNNNNFLKLSDKNLNFSEFSLKNSPRFFNERPELYNMQAIPPNSQNNFENNLSIIHDSMGNNFNSMPFCDSYSNFPHNNLSLQSLPNFLPSSQEQAGISQTNNFANIIAEDEQLSLACNFNNFSNLQPNLENKNANSFSAKKNSISKFSLLSPNKKNPSPRNIFLPSSKKRILNSDWLPPVPNQITKRVKIQVENFEKLINKAAKNNKKTLPIDPSIFREKPISEKNLLQLEEFEQNFIRHARPNNESFQSLYGVKKFCDVTVVVESEEFLCHKVVLSSSPQFNNLLSNPYKMGEVQRLNLPAFFKLNSFHYVLKFMYLGELKSEDMEKINPTMTTNMYFIALNLKLYYLAEFIACRMIMPSMDPLACLEILKDESRKDKDPESLHIIKFIFKYAIAFFANSSKTILNDVSLKNLVLSLENEIILLLLEKALSKSKDLSHFHELLDLALMKNLGNSILDLLKLSRKSVNSFISCEARFLNFEKDVFISKEPCLIPFEKNSQTLFSLGKTVNVAANPDNFFELEPDFELKLESHKFKDKILISEIFHSESRKWRLIIFFEMDSKVSIFIKNCGANQTAFFENFHLEFNSALFRVQVCDQSARKELWIFHSFTEQTKYLVGMGSFTRLGDKHEIEINVWVKEMNLYSACLTYISEEFQDLAKNAIRKKDLIIERKPEPEIMLKEQPKQNEVKNYKDLILGALSKQVPLEERKDLEIKKEAKLANINYNISKNNFSLYDIDFIDSFFIFQNDNLNIDQEKILLFFIYKFIIGKAPEEVSSIISTVRFEYLELEFILNAIHDHEELRKNKFFQNKVEQEFFRRFQKAPSINLPRKKYIDNKPKEKDSFLNELIKWLAESDHHEGYRNKLEFLKQQLKEKDNAEKHLLLESEILKDQLKKVNRTREIHREVERNLPSNPAPPNFSNVNNNVAVLRSRDMEENSLVTIALNNCNIF